MKRGKAKADRPVDEPSVVEGAGLGEGDRGSVDSPEGIPAAAETAETIAAPHQELLTSWWTTAALAWGPPVRMWSEIVAAAWRPFLPPTALTAEGGGDAGRPPEQAARADGPPAQPAPQAPIRTPRADVPKRPVPGPRRR